MEMTQEWIDNFNKKCAEFLKMEYELHSSTWRYNGKITTELLFHTDWNWIMEVIEHIVKLPSKHDGNFLELNGKVFNIKHVMFHQIIGNKETLIKIVDQFIDWYNKQKEL